MSQTAEIEYLLMGNSHVLALQEEHLAGSVNVASYAEAIHHTYYKLNHLINDQKATVKNLVLSYDLGLLREFDVDNQPYQYYWNRHEDWWELLSYSNNRLDFLMNRAMTFIFPYKDGEVDAFDYLFATKEQNEEEALRDTSIPKITAMHRSVTDECLTRQISEPGLSFFKKILDLCAERKINLYLVRFPMTEAYYVSQSSCYEPSAYYQHLMNYFPKGSNVFVLDFHDLYDDSKFRDPHHLKGGLVRENFTKLVSNQLDRLSELK